MEGSPDILSTLLTHSDKGMSAILLIFFVVKLLPEVRKLAELIRDLKEISDRRERQSDQTQKEVIRLLERLKYQQVGAGRFDSNVPPQKVEP